MNSEQMISYLFTFIFVGLILFILLRGTYSERKEQRENQIDSQFEYPDEMELLPSNAKITLEPLVVSDSRMKVVANNFDYLVLEWNNPKPGKKIAAFDIDGTITIPEKCFNSCYDPNGNVEAGCQCGTESPAFNIWNGYRNWRFAIHPNDKSKNNPIPKAIAELYRKGHRIVFITNQSGFGRSRGYDRNNSLDPEARKIKSINQKRQDMLDKCTEILHLIDSASGKKVPVTIIAGISSKYQKPCPSLWGLLTNEYNADIRVECSESFYCGDAAGRLSGNTTDPWQNGMDARHPGVYTAQDQLFAFNAGVKFYSPEEKFLDDETGEYKQDFDLNAEMTKAKCTSANAWSSCEGSRNNHQYPSFPQAFPDTNERSDATDKSAKLLRESMVDFLRDI